MYVWNNLQQSPIYIVKNEHMNKGRSLYINVMINVDYCTLIFE